MELTTFTTAQIYSIFAALSCAAIAGLIFYCIGLRTGNAAGYELGRATAKDYWTKIVGHIRADLGEARDLLDIRTRDTASLRQAMQHIERDLLQRLAAAAPLTEQDQAVLLAAADKLMLAGSTFAGLGSNEHARASNHLMAQVLDIADRIKKAQANTQPHPDSELIDFLATIANLKVGDGEWCIELPVMFQPHRNASMREVIRHYQTELEKLENEYEETQEAARDMEDAA